MDVYSQREERAHSTGFVGISADTDDVIDNLEVYEALINPRESERAGGQNGGGMMPPMMGMGGAGGGAAGAAQGGLGSAAGGGAAAAAVTMRTAGAGSPGVAPIAGPAVASAGIGTSTGPGAAGMGAAGLGAAGIGAASGPAAAGAFEPAPGADVSTEDAPADEVVGGIGTEGSAPRADVVAVPPGNPDVISVDPAQVEKVAREWSDLAARMAEVGNAASDLQASLEDFGLVKQPAGPYGEMTNGIRQLAGGASKEFDEIAAGLTYGAQAYRDQEAAAAQTVRSAQ